MTYFNEETIKSVSPSIVAPDEQLWASSVDSEGFVELSHITPEHLAEWVQGSGVPVEITRRAIVSLSDRTIVAERLGWKKYSDNLPLGWWCSGLDLSTMEPQIFGQYKPNYEIPLNPKKPDDTSKYISTKGTKVGYDAIALPHPDPDYWQRIIDDPSIPIYPIEGPKKAGALIGLDYCALALCGVTMGLQKGGKKLVKNLDILAVHGRPVYLPWDADLATNSNVRKALIALATILNQKGCRVFVAVIPPELQCKAVPELKCKAVDDVLVSHGPEMVTKIMADAVPYSQWLKNLEKQVSESKEKDGTEKSKKKDYPAASTTAREVAENYRGKLAWQSEYQLWMHYGAEYIGCWAVATEESVKEIIHCHLESAEVEYSAGFVSSVATILKSKLEVKKWNERTDLIPLRDGVLELATGKLLPHAPGYRFTYQLPYKWADRAIGCAPIEEFLVKITGSQAIAEVLLAYLTAIVTGRADIQRFLELIGGGQTGKSTFMALAEMLVGEENTVCSQLKLLESNQFETAKFYRKRLILFPDSERWQGGVSILKQLTGQDSIRYERKGVQQCRDFRFEGMVILSANEAPESSDRTSGLERRKLTIALENRLPEYDGRDLKKEFAPYLPGLLKRVLEISPERVFQFIKHTERYVPAVAAKKFEQLTETNPIAAWLDERIVVGPDLKAQVGTSNPDYAGKWLYANFCQYQSEMGHKGSLSLQRFKSNLRDLLKNQLKIVVTENRTNAASFVNGIALRCLEDPAGNLPRPVTGIATNSGGVEAKSGDTVVARMPDSGGFGGCGGVFEDSRNSEIEIHPEAPEQIYPEPTKTEKQSGCGGDSEKIPPHPPSSPLPILSDIPEPAQESPLLATNLNEDELDLLQMIRTAVAEPDTEIARQATADILPILKDTCGKGAASREKIWAALTEEERIKFSFLAKSSERPTISEQSAKPIADCDNPPGQEPSQLAPEPAPAEELAELELAQIAPEDAEKIRDIALIWWEEYYPEQFQTLIAQMYAWNAPGTRYDAATITAWLEGEDVVVRERITELVQQRSEGA
jgi:putative DNA primase/helicase